MSDHLSQASRTVFRYIALIGVAICCTLQPSRSHADAAIAFGQYGNGGWASGTAYNFRTRAEAENYAMSNCNARGYNCAIRTTFHSACAALAVQDNGNGWAISVHPDVTATHGDALTRCAQYGLSCSIRESFCDNVDGDAIREAEQNQRRAEYDEYVRQWHACFADEADLAFLILACSEALGFPRAIYDDRRKLTERRGALIGLREQRERDAREERIRTRQAVEQAAREAEQRAAEASAAARQTKEEVERERQAREEQKRSQQAAEQAARQAEQRAAEASAAARQAEQRAREAERAAQLAGQNRPPKPLEDNLLKKPVPEVYAALVFLFCLYAALKEIIKARVAPRYKFLAVFSIAFGEWFIFWIIGVSPTDPKLADVLAVSAPLLGIWVGFEFLPKPAAA